MKSKFMMRTKSTQVIPQNDILSRPQTPFQVLSYSDTVTLDILESSDSSIEKYFSARCKSLVMGQQTPRTFNSEISAIPLPDNELKLRQSLSFSDKSYSDNI